MYTYQTQTVGAFGKITDGKITIESEFDGTLHLNLAGDPSRGEFNLSHPKPIHIRITGPDEDLNIGFTRKQIKHHYEQLQQLDEETDLFED